MKYHQRLSAGRLSSFRWPLMLKEQKKASGSDLLILAPLGTNHGRHWPKSLKATGQIKEEIPPRLFQSSRPSCSLGIEILVLCKFLSADHIRIANRSGRSDARYMQISAGTETESETNISETCEAMCARKTWSEVIAPIHVVLSSVGGKCVDVAFLVAVRGGSTNLRQAYLFGWPESCSQPDGIAGALRSSSTGLAGALSSRAFWNKNSEKSEVRTVVSL